MLVVHTLIYKSMDFFPQVMYTPKMFKGLLITFHFQITKDSALSQSPMYVLCS